MGKNNLNIIKLIIIISKIQRNILALMEKYMENKDNSEINIEKSEIGEEMNNNENWEENQNGNNIENIEENLNNNEYNENKI